MEWWELERKEEGGVPFFAMVGGVVAGSTVYCVRIGRAKVLERVASLDGKKVRACDSSSTTLELSSARSNNHSSLCSCLNLYCKRITYMRSWRCQSCSDYAS